MAKEYYTFEEVLNELQVDEDELKRLVSQGELRGFRDGASMKFRTEDVDKLKKGRETEPTIILTDSDADISLPSEQDLVVDEESRERETVLNMDVFDTEELPSLTQGEEGLQPTEAIPAPTPAPPTSDVDEGAATIIDVTAPSTEERPADTRAEAFAAVEDYEAVSPTRAGSGRISRSARLRTMQMKRRKSHVLWTVFLFFTTIFVVWPGVFLFNTIRNVAPQYALDMGDKFRGIGDWFMSIFAS
jgi:excisionase family DNA binding protein